MESEWMRESRWKARTGLGNPDIKDGDAGDDKRKD